MAQARKRQVRSTRTANKSVPAKEETTLPPAPTGTEEVGATNDDNDTALNEDGTDPAYENADDTFQGEADDAQKAPGADEKDASGDKGDTYDYIDAEGRVKPEKDGDDNDTPADEAELDDKTDGKGFSGGERYTPPTGKVTPPAGRIIPVGGELTFDGMDFGTHIVSTEDVYQEVIPMGSKRRSYVLKIRKGTTLPRTKYQNLTEG